MSNANHLAVKWNSIMRAMEDYVNDVKEQAIHQEREACAKIVIDIGYSDNPVEAMMPKGIKRMVADQIIEAIRDRK
jgi:hypothetical protein